MRAPEPVRKHPNAAFVLSMAPPAALVAWLVSLVGLKMSQEAAAGAAVVITSAALVFAHAMRRCGSAVWQFGIVGVCRHIWKGDDGQPTPAVEPRHDRRGHGHDEPEPPT